MKTSLALALCFFTWPSDIRAQGSSNVSAAVPAQAIQLPLSGASPLTGSVTRSQSLTNAGGGSGVNLLNSRVVVTGPFQGSEPEGISTGTVLPLRLDYALTLGLRRNLGAVVSSQGVRQAEALALSARSRLLPHVRSAVTETVQQLNLRTLGVSLPGAPAVVGPFNYFDARLAQMTEAIDFTRYWNWRAASKNVQAAQDSVRDARDLVVLAVGGAYLQLIATNARINAGRAQVETSRVISRQADDRLRNGLAPRLDASRARVQLQTEQQRLRSLEAEFARQKLALGRVIGLPPGQDFSLADDFVYQPANLPTLDEALARAYRGRSDLKATEAGLGAAQLALKAARGERLPTLGVSADYGATGLRPTYAAHGTFNVTATLSIPIYQGGQVRAGVEQAGATIRQRQAELADLRGRIDQEIREAFIDLKEADDQVDLARSNVELAQDTLQQARDRFAAGVADTVEVVQAQQAVAQSDNDFINAVFGHNLAKVALARAMGEAEQGVRQFLLTK